MLLSTYNNTRRQDQKTRTEAFTTVNLKSQNLFIFSRVSSVLEQAKGLISKAEKVSSLRFSFVNSTQTYQNKDILLSAFYMCFYIPLIVLASFITAGVCKDFHL